MKNYKHLYPEAVTFANLYWAWRAAHRGKLDRQVVRASSDAFEFDLEHNL